MQSLIPKLIFFQRSKYVIGWLKLRMLFKWKIFKDSVTFLRPINTFNCWINFNWTVWFRFFFEKNISRFFKDCMFREDRSSISGLKGKYLHVEVIEVWSSWPYYQDSWFKSVLGLFRAFQPVYWTLVLIIINLIRLLWILETHCRWPFVLDLLNKVPFSLLYRSIFRS